MEQNTNTQEDRRRAWSLLKKIFKFGLIVLIIILALLVWVGNNLEYVNNKFYTWQAERYDKAMKEYESRLVAQYTADKDGGKTPEETIDLFIAALKAGDIEQASKYYVLDKQEETLNELKDEVVKYGDLNLSIEYFVEIKEKGAKKCNPKGDGCTFEYVYITTEEKTLPVRGRSEIFVIPKGEESAKSFDVELNSLSGVWKIE